MTRPKTYEEIKAQCEANGLELHDRRYLEGKPCLGVSAPGRGHAIYNVETGVWWCITPSGVRLSSSERAFGSILKKQREALIEFFTATE